MRRTFVRHLYSGALFGVPVVALAMLFGQGPAAANAQDDPSKETPSSGSAAGSQETNAGATAETKAEQPAAEAKADAGAAVDVKADAGAAPKDAGQTNPPAASADPSKAAVPPKPAADAGGDAAADTAKTQDDATADQPKGDRPRTETRDRDPDRDRGDARGSDRDRRGEGDRRSRDDRRRRIDDEADRNRDRDDRDQADRTRDRDDRDQADQRDRDDDRRFSRDRDDDRRGRRDRDSRVVRFGVAFSVGGSGLVVTRIAPNTIAARVGILADDVIVSVNGHRIVREAEFERFLFADAGDRVTIIVLRDGREQTLYVEPADLEKIVVVREDSVLVEPRVNLGIVIDDQVADAAIVLEVDRNSPADKVGVREGDRIVAINGKELSSPDMYHQVVGTLRPGDEVDLEFGDRETETVQLRLDGAVSVEADDVDVRVRESGPDVRVRTDRDPVRVEGAVEIEGGPVIEGEIRGGTRTEQPRRRILPRPIFNRQ